MLFIWLVMSRTVEILSIGNELLMGKILNTNARWLARRCTSLGLEVRRITVVGDDEKEICSAVKEALSRRPRFIITTGGLGPTLDDKTIESIAKCLDLELKVDEEALSMVREAYKRLVEEGRLDSSELTPQRVKMARMPEGARPLPNPVGTAPGMLLEVDGTTIISLPGVPAEMEAIFEESVLPVLKRAAGDVYFYETRLIVHGIVESDLAPILEDVMRANPHVYIKSHPRWEGKTAYIEVYLSTTARDASEAKSRIGSAVARLTETVAQRAGGKIRPA